MRSETTFDAAGTETKRVDYTFGHDEIAQTVTENGVSTTHVFCHDGHGSVRVLYDLAGAVAQVFTFAAYGHMIAVHSGTGAFVAGGEGAALSSLGYSGEVFDLNAQQQYLRARFYDPATGCFNRLDPFAGNMQDPQSLHKYAYVPGDPILGVDPTGREFSLVGSIAGSTIGAQLNSMTGEAGNLVAESFQRKAVAWDTIGWTLAFSFIPFASVIGDDIARSLGPLAKDAFDRLPWVRSAFKTIDNLPSDLVLQLAMPQVVRRAVFQLRMFAEHGYAMFGKYKHHLIPISVVDEFPELMKRAARGGFDTNSAYNGKLLKGTGSRYTDELFDDGYRHFWSHPEYNDEVRTRLQSLETALLGATDDDVAGALASLVSSLSSEIDNLTIIVR